MGDRWYVVQAQFGREMVAEERLASKGHTIYMPRFMHYVKKKEGMIGVPRSLFGSYMFGYFDLETEQRSVLSTIGVARMIGGEKPEPVRYGVVESMIHATSEEGMIDIGMGIGIVWRAREGDMVKINEGSFEGLIGRCLSSSGARVRVLLALLGGEVPVSFGHGAIEPAPLAHYSGGNGTSGAAASFARYDRAVKRR